MYRSQSTVLGSRGRVEVHVFVKAIGPGSVRLAGVPTQRAWRRVDGLTVTSMSEWYARGSAGRRKSRGCADEDSSMARRLMAMHTATVPARIGEGDIPTTPLRAPLNMPLRGAWNIPDSVRITCPSQLTEMRTWGFVAELQTYSAANLSKTPEGAEAFKSQTTLDVSNHARSSWLLFCFCILPQAKAVAFNAWISFVS